MPHTSPLFAPRASEIERPSRLLFLPFDPGRSYDLLSAYKDAGRPTTVPYMHFGTPPADSEMV